jgi:hypothetical protein
MGSVTNSPSGLTYLTQPGGLLSNLTRTVSASTLQSASPQDIVNLSLAAIQAQQADGLFGAAPSNPESSSLPDVSPTDLTGATPTEQTSINAQTILLQQAQALFST